MEGFPDCNNFLKETSQKNSKRDKRIFLIKKKKNRTNKEPPKKLEKNHQNSKFCRAY